MSKKTSLLASCFLPLVALAILCIVVVGLFLVGVPGQAEDLFGPPSPHLSSFQHYRLSAQLLIQKDSLLQPIDASGDAKKFEINLGEPTTSVIQRLAEDGFVRDADAFRNFLVYAGLDTSLQAGPHEISQAMTAIQIARAMQDVTPGDVTFSILPGWRLEEIAAALPYAGLEVGTDEFLAATSQLPDSWPLAAELPQVSSLEGLLFPGAYEVPRQATVEELLRLALDRYAQELTGELRSGFATQGLSIYQATILASIVQREAVVADEMPVITSVFLNRLAAGMKLDSDPTVQYAVGNVPGRGGWWVVPLSARDLQVDSSYNTYLYSGLPPGPIGSPGADALRAVAFPAQTPYYYFRARCDGTGRHAFAETYEQHLNNACP
jgi:UPF0755 protein